MQALLRRARRHVGRSRAYADGFLEIDYPGRRVTIAGARSRSRRWSSSCSSAFVQHPNQVLSRDQLLDLVWGDPYGVSDDQVKLYVGYLRRKLAPAAPDDRTGRDGPRLRLPLPQTG